MSGQDRVRAGELLLHLSRKSSEASPGFRSGEQRPARQLFRDFVADFLRYARPDVAKAVIFLALGAAVEGIGLLLLVPLLSVVIGGRSGSALLDQVTTWIVGLTPAGSRVSQLAIVLGIFLLVMVLRGLVIRTRDILLARLQVGFVATQRLQATQLLTRSRWDTVTRLKHGRVLHVLGGDIDAAGNAASFLLQSLVSSTLLVGQAALMFLLSPALAGFIFILLLLSALVVRPFLRRASEIGQSLTTANLSMVTWTSQFLGGLKLALSQNLQSSFLRNFGTTLDIASDRRVAFVRQRTEMQLVMTTVGALVACLVILAGYGLFGAAAPTLLAFLFILSRMVAPLSQLQLGVQQVFHSLPAYEKVKALQSELGAGAMPEHEGEIAQAALPKGPVVFRGVSFQHSVDRLEAGASGVWDLDLTIDLGTFVGIVGPSGAGKTTFCDLLVGLYPPAAGAISIGGMPLDPATRDAWRSSLSYVSQDPFLFHETVRNNLLWARSDASEAELWSAIQMAGAETLVGRLPDGLDTVVGERGSLVSGGERQRIALARGLLRRPRLLVLDEATNAIDVDAEAELLQRICSMSERPTIVMVAHREASLRFCDRLIEFREGRIVGDR